MIPAEEALKLPTAKLTDEEIAAVDKLEAQVEEHIRKTMAFRGCDLFKSNETNPNVIAALSYRLEKAGYNAQIGIMEEKHRLNAALKQTVGFVMNLSPKAEFYRDVFV